MKANYDPYSFTDRTQRSQMASNIWPSLVVCESRPKYVRLSGAIVINHIGRLNILYIGVVAYSFIFLLKWPPLFIRLFF